MKPVGFFVTGTDTGVGKTLVSCALLEKARQLGLTTAAVKPVAAGAVRTPQGLRNEDALLLQRHMTLTLPYEAVNPVCFEAAIAPHLAAIRSVSCPTTVWELKNACTEVLEKEAALTLIEGAGGWLVPVNDTETLADLPRVLNLPVILVVGLRLGCINHALLTAQAIRQAGVELAGWVANLVDPDMEDVEGNILTLQQRIRAPLLGRIAFMAEADPVVVANCFDDPVTGSLFGLS